MMTISVDHSGLDRDLDRIGAAFSDGRVPLRRFYQYFRASRLQAWNRMTIRGGDFLGVHWPPMEAQYVRKDGTVVPPEGQVPRVAKGFAKAGKTSTGQRRGISTGARLKKVGGMVSGKLRPSGRRVTGSSVLMRDTGPGSGSLQNQVLPPRPDHVTRSLLRIGGGVKAERVWQLLLRPVLFFIPSDQPMLQKIAEDYAREIIANKQGGDRAA